tara:strand:- start:1330 stop:2100 length:771 start_codon:yes stop_codon:yes gene_type:complete
MGQETSMKAIAYYRVSTASQGRSGLGLDAQRHAVQQLAMQRGLSILAEFTEVETGRRDDRPVLKKALARAKLTEATLVIAKLDRLSRNAAFLLTLRDSGARFLAADIPDANDLTIGVLAVISQAEREMISRRTTEALAAIKHKIARGEIHLSSRSGRPVTALGNPHAEGALGRYAGNLTLARRANARRTAARYRELAPIVAAIMSAGHTKPSAVAAELNRQGIATVRGAKWHASTAGRLIAARVAKMSALRLAAKG